MYLDYLLLLLIFIILVIICIYHTKNSSSLSILERFNINNPLVNLPASDIHFIIDDNTDLIDAPIFNYKLTILDTQNYLPQPSNTNTITNITKYITILQHKPYNIYKGLGQFVCITDKPYDNIKTAIITILDTHQPKCITNLTSCSIQPTGYNLIWTSDINTDGQIFSIWNPIAPAGCMSLGDIIVLGTEQPSLDLVACFPITMLEQRALSNGIIWYASNDMGKLCYCWGAGNINCFRASNIYTSDMAELLTVYNLPLSLLKQNTLRMDDIISKGITI